MDTFEDRLILQKRIYLLQALGLFLGYRFNWYVHGPYSPDLTREAFKLVPIFKQVRKVKFAKERSERRFDEYLRFLGKRKDDGDWLEQLACAHFLKAIYPEKTREEIITSVLIHETHFTRNQCEEAYDYLSEHGLIE